MLGQMDIEGRDMAAIAIDRLRAFEPAEGYYLAFSGGKDSQAIYHLAKLAGVKFEAHFHLCGGVDPPEVVYFVRQHYPDVIWDHPGTSMWAEVVKQRTPPTRLMRWCCKIFKEGHGAGRVVVTGVRWAESVRRGARRMTEACLKDSARTYLHPIIDWEDGDVWDFLNGLGVPHCNLYDEGRKRIGCVMCPMAPGSAAADAKRWPKIADAWQRAFGRLVRLRAQRGLNLMGWPFDPDADDYTNGAAVMAWWLHSGKHGGQNPGQETMYD